jgi:ligand-binding sensor domain-containing protein
MLKVRLFSLLILFSPITLHAQNYNVKTFTTKDGLAHNNVRVIAEDSTGFLWIGTWDGLSRFDGHEFRNYFHVPEDSTSLPYFSIRKLCVDAENNLWIFTEKREIVLFNRNTENFRILKNINGISVENSIDICVDEKGYFWIIGQNELFRREFKSDKYQKIRILNIDGTDLHLEEANGWISVVDKTKLWIASTSSVKEFALDSGSVTLQISYPIVRTHHRIIYFDHLEWFRFFQSVSGKKWVLSNIGLFKLNKTSAIFEEFNGEPELKELENQRKIVWGTIDDGIFLYSPKNPDIIHISSETSQLPISIMSANSNSIWLSNLSNDGVPLGLTRVVFSPKFFRNTFIKTSDSKQPAVYSITQDKDRNTWVGLRGINHILKINSSGEFNGTDYLNQDLYSKSGYVRSMIPVQDGIWIGYYMGLLQFYDYKMGQFVDHHPGFFTFRAMSLKNEDNIFIGIKGKLLLYNRFTRKLKTLWMQPENTNTIYKLFYDTSGIVWAGMQDSRLLKYDIKSGESRIYKVSNDNCNIEDILNGDNRELWIALLGGGICRFNPQTGSTEYFTTSSGLSNNTTYCLLKDKSGFVWVSTNNGISRINSKTGVIRNFDQTDGLLISEFNSGASYVTGDDEFIFGGMGGLVRFYPDSLPKTTENFKCRILLTDFSVSGEKKVPLKALNDSDTITLLKGETNFQLSFSSTDFLNSDKTLFRYKLNNANTDWIETNSHIRSVNYSNLKPGRYLFEIQATNINSEWTADKKIVFNITPYFYQTLLFRISVPLFIVFVLAGIIIVYIRQLKQKEKLKQDALKLQSLRGQMNPHFIFNSLNSINYFISNNDKLSANRYIADFSRLIRSILSNLGSDYIPFRNELDSIIDYLNIEHLRFGDKFDFELSIDKSNEKSDFEIFPGLVQPFIENAIWHGVRALDSRKGFIKVTFLPVESDRIRCSVEDDGIGWETSLKRKTDYENHNPRGINIVNERLQLISKLKGVNYHLEISDLYFDRKDKGTRVEIDIPVKSINKGIK